MEHKLKTLEENDHDKYIKAIERAITKRRQFIELLGQGKKQYDSLYNNCVQHLLPEGQKGGGQAGRAAHPASSQ